MRFAYPVSLDVADRRCVVVGGGSIAAEKAAGLRDAGADVFEVPADAYDAHVLDGAFLAIHTGEDDTDPAGFFADATDRGVLANVMDDIDHCEFAFPSIIERGDLKLAISTAGRAPALSRRLRLHLEEQLPEALGDLIGAVAEAREITTPRTIDWSEWVTRWRDAVDDLDRLLELAEAGRTDEIRGHVVATVVGEQVDARRAS
ncbi:MAG: bifunctional precorrin-2 dehydrogenase/sirohydrochlorin ferrochelatase [Actinobacteria bacterium]|nr:bifunctional precorrin-2 dehydrogenase/sirohydrochlorin ferrochelatase [Actinomycetota bacterium]